MTLYEIDRRISELIDPETGELLDYEAYSALSMERGQKIENTALLVKNLEAEAKVIREEEAALLKRRRVKEATAARLRQYIQEALQGEVFETARCAITYRKSDPLQIDDLAKAVEWLEGNGHFDLVTRSAPTLDKRAAKALLKAGENVPGLRLEERQNMQLR